MKNQNIIFLLILFLFTFLFSSCMSQIAEIKKNPYDFNGKEVNVDGTVEKVKILKESQDYNAPVPLLLYTIKDSFDEIAILSTDKVYTGQYKRVNGKVIVFRNNLYENEIQFVIKEITEFLMKKNALPSSKQKEAQKAFISIIAAIINLLTNGKLTEPVNSIADGAQTVINSNLNETDKQYITEITQSLINFLPKDEYYYLILEN